MNRCLPCLVALSSHAVAVGLLFQPAFAVTLNQIDTFQTGTTLNWAGNASPTNIASGGSDGAGDGYLEISTVSFHLATFNTSAPWIGNYTGAGIKAIEVDMNHVSGDPVSIRLLLFSAGGTFASTVAKPIADGVWKRYQFGLSAADLTDVTVGGGGDLLTTLASVSRLLIRYDIAQTPTPAATQTGDITATLGIDNIRGMIPGDVNYDGLVNIFDINLVSSHWSESGPMADANDDGLINIFDINLISSNWSASGGATAVPEPASLLLAALGAVGLLVLKRRRSPV